MKLASPYFHAAAGLKAAAFLSFLFLLTAASWAFTVSEPYLSVCPSSTGVLELVHSAQGQYTVGLEGKAAAWAKLTSQKVTVLTKPVVTYIYITVPSATPTGTYPLEIVSTTGKDVEKVTINIDVDNCFRLALLPSTDKISVCAGERAQTAVIARNDGKFKESVRLYTDDWAELGEHSFDILPGAEHAVPVFLSAQGERGSKKLSVRMESSTSDAKASAGMEVTTEACRKVTFTAPQTFEVCKDRNIFKAIKFKNEGRQPEVLTLEPDAAWITPQDHILSLPVGEEREALYLIEPTVPAGEYSVNFKTFTSGQQIDIPVKVVVKDCFAFDVSISPSLVQACAGEVKDIKVTVANRGEFDADFTGIFSSTVGPHRPETLSFALKANETGGIGLQVPVPADAGPGEHTLSAGFTNKVNSQDATAKLQVLPKEICFGVRMAASPTEVSVLREKGEVIEIPIKNTGKAPLTYNLSVLGVGWAMVRPQQVAIVPGDEAKAYLYVSPTLQTALGDYEVGVAAVSGQASALAKATVHVVEKMPAGPTGLAVARGPDFKAAQLGYFFAAVGVVLVLVIAGIIRLKPAV